MQFSTDRLLIRSMTDEDWRANQSIIKDFNQSDSRIYDMPLPEAEGEVKALTARWVGSGLFFSVCLAETSQMIGYVCFHNADGCYDLGYCFHSDYHGRGYAYESCSSLMQYLKQSTDVICFTASTALENRSSCRLLGRLGFALEKTEALSFHKDEFGKDISFRGGRFIRE